MKRLLAIALVAASVAVPSAGAAQFSTRTLSDIHVGKSKTELVAQRDYSQRIIRFFDKHHWMLASRHRTCWSHVPWSHTCNRARQTYRAHRWLHELAVQRLEPTLVVGGVPHAFYLQAMCVHSHEGAWPDDTGNGFGGGLQFMVSTWNTAARLSGGVLPYVSTTAEIGRLSPMTQIYGAYMIVLNDGSWREWPQTARMCRLL